MLGNWNTPRRERRSSNHNRRRLLAETLECRHLLTGVGISLSATSGTETEQTLITVTATNSDGNVTGNQTVDVAVSGTGITPTDFLLSSSTITILDGQSSGSVWFTVQDDSEAEALVETATITLGNPSAGIALGASVASDVAITDDDFLTPVINALVFGNPTNASPITMSVNFGADVTGFVEADVSVTGGLVGGFANQGNGVYSFNLTPATDGDLTVDIAAGAAVDVGGKDTLAADQFVITSDRTEPTPTITGPASPIGTASFDVTIAFGEPVVGFVPGDITVGRGSVTALVDAGGGTYTATIAASDGPVTVDVTAGVAKDQAGNDNSAANQFSINVDAAVPKPTILGTGTHTADDPFEVTIDFGEPISGFVDTEVSVVGGDLINLADNGVGVFTATIDATSDGVVTIDISADVALDSSGNANVEADQFSIIVDTVAPAPTITGPISPTANDPFTVTVDFGEVVTGFSHGDLSVTGGNVTNLTDDGAGVFTATIDATADGTVRVDLTNDVANDLAGNGNTPASQFSVVVDSTSPVPVITGPSSPSAVNTFDVTIDFGEAVSGFIESDVTVSGGAVTGFAAVGSGVFTATITADGDGQLTVDVGADVATDGAGNSNVAATQFSIVVDSDAPLPSISGPAGPISNNAFQVMVDFGEVVSGFVHQDLEVIGGTPTSATHLGNGLFRATILADVAGPVTVQVPANVATDIGDRNNAASNLYSIVFDPNRPTPTITGPVSTNASFIHVTIDFGEVVTGLAPSDLSVFGGTVTNLQVNADGTFTATINIVSNQTVVVDIAADVTNDLAGNGNAAADTFVVTIDQTSPSPVINGPSAPVDGPFDIIIDFGEEVIGFESTDLTIVGGSVTGFTENGNGVFTATIEAVGDGTVNVDIASGVAADLAGNASGAASPFAVEVDTTPPTPTIGGPNDPVSNNPFLVTIDFGEAVTGFTSGDLTVSGGIVTGFSDLGGGAYTATIDASIDGAVTVDILAGVASDKAFNASLASATFEVTVDTTAPTPTITGPRNPTGSDPFSVTIDFGEVVTGFDVSDVSVIGGVATVVVDLGGGSYVSTVDAIGDGPVAVSIVSGAVVDAAGNVNDEAGEFSILVDTIAPRPTIVGPANPTNNDSLEVVIDFGEPVIDFVAADIAVDGGSVTNLVSDGNGRFTATIDATTDGTVTIDVGSGVTVDEANNANLVAVQFSTRVDTIRPVPILSGPARPHSVNTFDVSIDFGESVLGFSEADLNVAGGTVTGFSDVGGGSYIAAIEVTSNADVIIDVAADAANDEAGNPSEASVALIVTVMTNLDFGDAPTSAQSGFANSYPVTFAQDGARHVVGSLTLGALIEADGDGTPSANADGDGDEEDGVVFLTSLVAASASSTSSVLVTVSGAGKLDGWLDFNRDGDWNDAGEQIFDSTDINLGRNVLSFTVPDDVDVGETAARFRVSTSGGLLPVGEADDGEVEDYLVSIIDGEAAPTVTVATAGLDVDVSVVDDRVVVLAGDTELINLPTANVHRFVINGTNEDESLTIDSASFAPPPGGAQLNGGLGEDDFVILGAGRVDLTTSQFDVNGFQRFDLTSDDPNTLVVDAAAISAAAPVTKSASIVSSVDDKLVVADAADWMFADPITIDGRFSLIAQNTAGGGETIVADVFRPWQNFLLPGDVNNDRDVTAGDALAIINELGRRRFSDAQSADLDDPLSVAVWPSLYYDHNGDGRVTSLDALRVINDIARRALAVREAERSTLLPFSSSETSENDRREHAELIESTGTSVSKRSTDGRFERRVTKVGPPPLTAHHDKSVRAIDEMLADEAFVDSLKRSLQKT